MKVFAISVVTGFLVAYIAAVFVTLDPFIFLWSVTGRIYYLTSSSAIALATAMVLTLR